PRRENPRADHGEDHRALVAGGRTQPGLHPEAAHGPQDSRDMAMRTRADDLKSLWVRWQSQASVEQRLEAFDEMARPVGEIREGAFTHFGAVAVGLAQQDCRWRIAIGNALNIHGHEL